MPFKSDTLTGSSTSLSANHLISVSEVCSYLGSELTLPATSMLIDCIGYVSTSFESYCNRKLKAQELLGYYDGDGSSTLRTNNSPIISVSALRYRTNPTQAYQNIIQSPDSISANCILYDRNIELYNYTFYCGQQSIQIHYTAGFETIPNDIKKIAIEAVVINFKESYAVNGADGGRLGVSNMNSGSNNFNTSYIALDERHEKVLNKYKRLPI